MLRQLIINKLNTLKEAYVEVPGSDWIQVHCQHPDHTDAHMSAGINTTSGIHHCFSSNDHNFMFLDTAKNSDEADILWKARYQNLKKDNSNEYPDYETIVETQIERRGDIVLPPVDHMLTDYWRGICPGLLADADAYYCSRGKYRGRNVFPLYQHKQLCGVEARIVDASANMIGAKWYRSRNTDVKSLTYPLDVLTKRFRTIKHIVIAEGVLDALSYIQMGVPAIASFGLTPPSTRRITELVRLGVETVTISFDNDDAGRAGTLKVLPAYEEWFDIDTHNMVNQIRKSGCNDANDYLIKYWKG